MIALYLPLASFGGTAFGVLIVIGVLLLAGYSYTQKLCQFCGYSKNNWKSQFPVCQKCGRNRVTGGAGPSHE